MTIRDVITRAAAAATRDIGEAQVVSVGVELTAEGMPSGYDTMFVHEHRRLFGGTAVRTCQVSSRLDGGVTRTSPQAGFTGSLADLVASHRLPPAFSVDRLTIEPTDVLARVRHDPVIPWAAPAERQLGLGASRTGTAEWCVQYDVLGLGFTVVFLSAETGEVTFEQLHVAHDPALTVDRLGDTWERVGNAIDLARRVATAPDRAVPADARLGPLARCRACGDVLVQVWRPGHPTALAVAPTSPARDAGGVAAWSSVSPDAFRRRFIEGGEHLSPLLSQPPFSRS